MRIALILILTLAMAGCGRAQAPANIRLTSPAIGADGRIDPAYSAAGGNRSPALSWTAAPGARAYAVIVDDPDAPGPRPFVHWLIWNIPAPTTSLPAGLPATAEMSAPAGAIQGRNDHGEDGYHGPHPPSGVHHYHFKVFALNAPLALAPGADRAALGAALSGHIIATGETVGTFAAGR